MQFHLCSAEVLPTPSIESQKKKRIRYLARSLSPLQLKCFCSNGLPVFFFFFFFFCGLPGTWGAQSAVNQYDQFNRDRLYELLRLMDSMEAVDHLYSLHPYMAS